ncbi:MAG: hypothetical protein JWL73_2032 [Actinomycetia bacterium]|nr:hypothetical protein [Actinomycetes bacterium]
MWGMTDVLAYHWRAIEVFGNRVHLVAPSKWTAPTPNPERDVRALVNHLTAEQLRVPLLLTGRTVADIGDRFDGDVLGRDPVGAWNEAASECLRAFDEPGALDRTIRLPSGAVSAGNYCWDMTADLLIHTWDLSRAIDMPENLDPELVEVIYERSLPIVDRLDATGFFAPVVDLPEGSTIQTRLLALYGRRA